MSNRNKKNTTGDYEIGFDKTPEYTRYKKGQSGNPKGRPKRDEAVGSAKAVLANQSWTKSCGLNLTGQSRSTRAESRKSGKHANI
jgi:Family of unknown function (DUF5681)